MKAKSLEWPDSAMRVTNSLGCFEEKRRMLFGEYVLSNIFGGSKALRTRCLANQSEYSGGLFWLHGGVYKPRSVAFMA